LPTNVRNHPEESLSFRQQDVCVRQYHSCPREKVAEFLILTVILTFLLLLFGEIMPKIYSAQKTLAFCRF